MLRFDRVGYSYGDGIAVHDLSFHIAAGEFTALVGSNGAGKTTVTKLMNGLLKPQSGTVYLDGVATASARTSRMARAAGGGVGMLFQNPDHQISKNTVLDEIAFSLSFGSMSRAEQRERAAAIADEFGFRADAEPFALSRGERQLLALASVLVAEPAVLILDEPTCGLDWRECMLVMDKVRARNQAGTTVVMVCHDMEVVGDFCRRMLVMDEGRLLADGTPDELFRRADLFGQAHIAPPQMVQLALRFADGDDALSRAMAPTADIQTALNAVLPLLSARTVQSGTCGPVVQGGVT
ncbi:MAG: energy-coupling factor ABC transporter ATP-binding protein [Actinomycetes bacterium]|jgi:energy-coupling factor transport system ATP-binding protein|nr:energy-coupling factor ABC transporter ATP-binding protein [Actinomycetes bacterium]